MNLIYKILYNLYKKAAKCLSVFKNRRNMERLRNTNFSIISQNCIGAMISHDLNQRFLSPTVNLFMSGTDFINFVHNLKEFQGCQIHFIQTDKPYPVGYIEYRDIKVYLNFVHYNTEADAAKKWHERYLRINYENLFVIMTDRDGFNDEALDGFFKIPYKKILFTSQNIQHKDVVFCKEYEGDECVGDLTEYVSLLGRRGYERLDIVEWLNSGVVEEKND